MDQRCVEAPSPQSPLQAQYQAVELQLGADHPFPVMGHIHRTGVLQQDTPLEAPQTRGDLRERAHAWRAHVMGIVAAAAVLDAASPDPGLGDQQAGVELQREVEAQPAGLFQHCLDVYHSPRAQPRG